jgi:hypothetical protein
LTIAALLAIGMADGLRADRFLCVDGPAVVEATDTRVATIACSAARDAELVLSRCGISKSRRLEIAVHSERLTLWGMPIYGAYSVSERAIHITAFGACKEMMGRTPELCELDSAAFYRSVIAHEVAHAILHQTEGGEVLSLVEAEFIAAVVQVAAMQEDFRRAFLARVPMQSMPWSEQFRRSALLFDPITFIANAYRHFSRPGQGCGTIQHILAGGHPFPQEDD